MRLFGKGIAAFAITLLTLILLFVGVALIPGNAVKNNLTESAGYMLENESDFYYLREGYHNTALYDYADCLTLNILYSIGEGNALSDIFISPMYSGGTDTDPIEMLIARLSDGSSSDTIYDRYWHGMVIPVKLLALIMDIRGMRIVFLLAVSALMIVLSRKLWKVGQKLPVVMLWLAGVMVMLPIGTLSITYVPTILIMFAASIVMTRIYDDREKIVLLMICTGVMTAFFDFLTTETLTIVLPTAIGLILGADMVYSLIGCIAWLASYVLTYLIKWWASGLVLGSDQIGMALAGATTRQGGGDIILAADMINASDAEAILDGTYPRGVVAVLINIKQLTGLDPMISMSDIITAIVLALIAVACLIYLYGLRGRKLIRPAVIVGVGFIPILRFCVMNNHSIEHGFFTYRALYATIFCLVTGIALMIDRDLILKKGKSNGKTVKTKKKKTGGHRT